MHQRAVVIPSQARLSFRANRRGIFIALIEGGRLDLGSMVSHHLPLDRIEEAFVAMRGGDGIRSVIV